MVHQFDSLMNLDGCRGEILTAVFYLGLTFRTLQAKDKCWKGIISMQNTKKNAYSGKHVGKPPSKKKRRSPIRKLTIREQKFIEEYLIDGNASRSAKSAGYENPAVQGVRLLKNQMISTAIKIRQENLVKKLELSSEEVLKQLYYCCTRSARDFVDEEGLIQTDVNKLSDRAASTIDGIKQRVSYDLEGNKTVTTELKLVSKATAIELAMKNKGLFAPKKVEAQHVHKIDWDSLSKPPEKDSSDEINDLIDSPRRLPLLHEVPTILEAKYSIKELASEEEEE